MSQHTPGPWEQHSHALYSIWAGETQVAACRVMSENAEDLLASPYLEHDDDIAQANARLIAAAPELLNEAEAAHGVLCGCTSGETCGAPSLFAVIRKAQGQP